MFNCIYYNTSNSGKLCIYTPHSMGIEWSIKICEARKARRQKSFWKARARILQPKSLYRDLVASLGILVFSATQGTIAK